MLVPGWFCVSVPLSFALSNGKLVITASGVRPLQAWGPGSQPNSLLACLPQAQVPPLSLLSFMAGSQGWCQRLLRLVSVGG